MDYIIRIAKYVMLVAVTANFVYTTHLQTELIESTAWRIGISSAVLGLYLIGKLQNRARFSGFNVVVGRMRQTLTSGFDIKVERFLILGSVVFYIFCIIYPGLVQNGLINWFTNTIMEMYEVFFFGFIFKVIAFFMTMNILFRAYSIIVKLLSGQALFESSTSKPQTPFNDSYINQDSGVYGDKDGFTDYEDVTDND